MRRGAHGHNMVSGVHNIVSGQYASNPLITYICIDRRLELVCLLVVVLTSVGHDPVKYGLLLLKLFLFVIL